MGSSCLVYLRLLKQLLLLLQVEKQVSSIPEVVGATVLDFPAAPG